MLVLLLPSLSRAQSSSWIRLGAGAAPVYTRVDPAPGGASLDEVRLVQPVFMAHAGTLSNRIRLMTTLNLEGLTMAGGELTPGAWGEGFMDRRHPHTYVHELMAALDDPIGKLDGRVRLSLAAGKGFAPFGTDDPMVRPLLRYPVNHHLAQILERIVVILGMRAGPLLLEGGLFNGDEPERPGQWPRISRLGDSWSARATLSPIAGLEVQASHGRVHSPEHRPGAGTDQSKWSLSSRWDRALNGSRLYGLAEWARTSEAGGFFVFDSFLAEGAWMVRRHRLFYRFERTERPEEERSVSPFRSVRPHLENTIHGTTRWTIHSAGYGYRMTGPPTVLLPFIELSWGRVADVGDGLFDARSFYGRSSFWSLSAGLRLSLGMPMLRMGRYGVAQDTAARLPGEQHGNHEH